MNLFKRRTHFFFGRKATDVALSPDTMSGGMFSCLVTALSDGLSLLENYYFSVFPLHTYSRRHYETMCILFFFSLCVHVHACVHMEARTWHLPQLFSILYMEAGPLTGLTNLASHLVPRIPCLCLSGNCHWVPTPVQHLHVFWKSELQSSHLYGKCFFQWAIS